MSVKVRIPASLRSFTQGHDEVVADGDNVDAVINALDAAYPGMRERLCDENGVRRFVNIYLNEEDDIRFVGGLTAKLKAGDSLQIVPAIAGGV